MKKFYFTFGQVHTHRVNNITWDRDSICEIEADDEGKAREIMVAHFGQKWAFCYPDINAVIIEYFPRGVIPLLPKRRAFSG